MLSFISTYINISLLVYIIYSLIIITLIHLITKLIYRTNSKISHLNNDEFFVLNNKYELKNLFYFITYKLYRNRFLILNSGESKFSLSSKIKRKLSNVEIQVLDFYKTNKSPKDFNPENFNDDDFKQYYDSILNDLKSKSFFKSKNSILFSKILFYFGLIAISLPGIIISILLASNSINPVKILIGTLISLCLYISLLKNITSSRFTPNGLKAYNAFKNKCPHFKNSNSNDDINKLIIQNHYMYYFTTDDDDDDSDDGDDD